MESIYGSNPSTLLKARKVHFIGIGGIGVSAIARMMLGGGKQVSGSDRSKSLVTEELARAGAMIYEGHTASHITNDLDLVVYTIAIPANNPELMIAKKYGIPCVTYPEMIGIISRDKYTVAVAGTHGKTTTTAMLAQVCVEAEKDPTVIVGSLIKNHNNVGSNFIAGHSDLLIVEACEYQRSFLNLHPNMVIITNIETDHLDYYKDLKDIQKAFGELVAKVPEDGYVICNTKDKVLRPVLKKAKCTIIDWTASRIRPKLKVPGVHNVLNAKAVIATAKILGISQVVALNALADFAGTWRRFEYKGATENGALVYDDYAHHPTEIRATLAGAREFLRARQKSITPGQLIAVFQPHLYSRTKLLLKEFANSFTDADIIAITDIYAAREALDPHISSRDLVELIVKQKKVVHYTPQLTDAITFIKAATSPGDLVVILGAGDIGQVAQAVIY
ncbi:MAG: UDP-N-acetylmuramate--L-alanine ligase [Candidatus Vogelbacteria bacterium]|nr:UDP-N-acetylmuramate--L-alanine ligase [Candidatus Vogelbacteria bacterium]